MTIFDAAVTSKGGGWMDVHDVCENSLWGRSGGSDDDMYYLLLYYLLNTYPNIKME